MGLSGRYAGIEIYKKLFLKTFYSGGFPNVDPFFTFVANEKVWKMKIY